jgi:hypothetical protein
MIAERMFVVTKPATTPFPKSGAQLILFLLIQPEGYRELASECSGL